ncbi:SIS domain-containing protein [Streptococcus iniae]|uniref:SIS domain-containing protein n=1 Tax=Streptococcus iniae TaxID=1346 RepID=A0A3L8GSK8_STRIN|nr:SIS domain-containing protein [Streptococcus iniae]AGM97863.1 tagatose-6-phosphate aldose/ketose isomerase [Streptococcus iniae SF1]AHY14953.1 tagatose-6-phosphate ketose isomerase [Streptococcus iniae]AHY16825.1 tagatose-6-phosphate ketose isomerase [Streptococcus iniae]AJG25110.1 tagatose-6-phosphate ketose isomerase [Streptococcus iniae]APD31011.1 tagatose-6-phosphate ketose isomerase [Streptococcus iniae]
MFNLSKTELETLGAEITTREIKQQPELWQEAFEYFLQNKESIDAFLNRVNESANGEKIKVIFTGAGTSEYVGNSIWSYLQTYGNRDRYLFSSIASTDLVAAPHYYLYEEDTVILVSFARSGNSPESVASVDLASQLVTNCYHLTITCAKEGQLAKNAVNDDRNLLLLMPSRSNDAGFAMTGSFSCMMLTALLIFDQQFDLKEKQRILTHMQVMANDIIQREAELKALTDLDFERLVYLGSGSLAGLTREAQLKMLELTAGKVATVFDSSMGFRHGPKSFVNGKTLVIDFVNNTPYVRQYDLDILEEVYADGIALKTLAIGQIGDMNFSGDRFDLISDVLLPDVYLAFPMILTAQALALLTSVKNHNLPDTPSASGTVNRVVKGVTIHPYQA